MAISGLITEDGIFNNSNKASMEYRRKSLIEAVKTADLYLELDNKMNNVDKKDIDGLIQKLKETTEINDEAYTINPNPEEQTATIKDNKTGITLNIRIDENNKLIIEEDKSDDTENVTPPDNMEDLKVNVENENIYYIGKKLEFDCYGGIKSAKLNGNVIENGTVINEVGTYTLVLEDNYSNVEQMKFYVNDGLLALVKDSELEAGVQNVTVNDVEYNINLIKYDGDLVLDGVTENTVSTLTASTKTYEVGAATDVATSTTEAQNTVILKVNGNLTIDPNVTLTAVKSSAGYGGPKGMYICVDGTLTNNGTISMTARGAKAAGQDVYLWQNADGQYEKIPAVGGTGGQNTTLQSANQYNSSYAMYNKYVGGIAGNSGTDKRALAGGGSGTYYIEGKVSGRLTGYIANGANATSYSGGSGGGGLVVINNTATSAVNYNGYSGAGNGGSGGRGFAYDGVPSWYRYAAGGAGNPGGLGYYEEKYSPSLNGSNGTGGLLILFGKSVINNGTIVSNGSNSNSISISGQSSAAGRRSFRSWKHKYILCR